MDVEQGLNRLEFDQDGTLHDDIHPEADLEGHSLVDGPDSGLPQKRYPAPLEFPAEALLVHRFKQPGTETFVNLYRRPNDSLRQQVEVFLCGPLPLRLCG